MRIVRVQFGTEVHLVAIQNRTDERGVRLLICECGRSGWGQRGLANAHARPLAITGGARKAPTLPAPAPNWRHRIYEPMFDNRKDRREHLFYVWWQGSQQRAHWRTVLGSRLLCVWYGHQESHDVPGTCYFCNARHPARRPPRWRVTYRARRWVLVQQARRWAPAPGRDPTLRPGEGTQPSLIKGKVLRPVICKEHHYKAYRHRCPYCEMRHNR